MELWQIFLIMFVAYGLGLKTGYIWGAQRVLREWEEHNESLRKTD